MPLNDRRRKYKQESHKHTITHCSWRLSSGFCLLWLLSIAFKTVKVFLSIFCPDFITVTRKMVHSTTSLASLHPSKKNLEILINEKYLTPLIFTPSYSFHQLKIFTSSDKNLKYSHFHFQSFCFFNLT